MSQIVRNSVILSNKCDKCSQECKQTPYGSSVILCKKNIRLCMNCYFVMKDFDLLKQRCNLVKYLKKREIGV